MRARTPWPWFVAVAAAAALTGAPTAAATPHTVPASFVPQVLCVHSGWHYRLAGTPAERRHPEYVLAGRGWVRSWHTPYGVPGSNGECGWPGIVGDLYGGGLSFTVGTWQRAGGYARSTSDIARASVAEQVYRAYVIVYGQDGGSWREWPQTARACGLPTG